MTQKLLAGLALSAILVGIGVGSSWAAYDPYVYDNLQRSRDALLGQRDELERARRDTLSQIDRLQAKVARYDQYLRQVDSSLRDVNDTLDRLH